MKAFLEKLAYHLHDHFGDALGRQCIIFPNRRAGVFFRHYLQNTLDSSAWLPEIHTISGFMENLSGLSYADPIELNFELYRIYCGLVGKPETYDEFYYWGEMTLGDFNDIDKYLVNAGDLFRNMADLKDVDNIFDYLSPAQKELIIRFWSHFRDKNLSSEQQSFLGLWNILHPLYTGFREVLFSRQTGYEGLVYREVAERIGREEYPDIPGEKVIICGFNALSAAERQLFRHLRNSGRALFYWDYDQQYREDTVAEAGRFIRRNLEEFPPDPDFPEDFNNLGKRKVFRVFNLPSDVLQAKKLHKLLSERELLPESSFSDTAVILCDEDLLQPVLSSLPDNIPGLNITMGYPLRNTPVFSFIDNLLRLQKNFSSGSDQVGGRFYYKDVLSVLNHQYTRAIPGKDAEEMSAEIHKRNMIYIRSSFFEGNQLFSRIFRKAGSATEMISYLSEILDILVSLIMGGEEQKDQLPGDGEFIFHIRTRLNKLYQVFSENPAYDGLETFIRLFRKLLSSSRIPFEGEPLQGIQLMGILETRLLDFDKLVFLSLNEGVMPDPSAGVSSVPASLRYAFGMPTREDKDAIYAYYFYRLIQRANHIDIMYNSKTEGLNTGEPGRYIYQLKYLYNFDIRYETVSFRTGGKKPEAISIDKTDAVIAKLTDFTLEGSRKLSPTSITTYLDCPLRFYFTYIAGIREEEEAAEDIDAPGFGNLLHKAMELLYEPFVSVEVTQADFKRIMQEDYIKGCLDDAFRQVFYKSVDPAAEVVPEGRNIIVYEVIRKMVSAILKNDSLHAPFRILALEEKVERICTAGDKGRGIRIGGTIDRRDERDGLVRIVDYKTGRAEKVFTSLDQLFERENWPSGKSLKAILQTFVYAWIIDGTSDHAGVKPELYVAGELFMDDFSPDIFIKADKEDARPLRNFSEIKDDFGSHLAGLIHDIFDRNIPFSQTEDINRCSYCPYSGICHRPGKSW